MNDRGLQSGFTLIENLIALAIVGLVFVAFTRVVSSETFLAGRTEAAGRSLMLARSLLARVGSDIAIAPGKSSGIFPGGGSWQVSIGATGSADPSAGPALYTVEVDVAAPGAAPVSLTTIRLAGR